MVEKKKAAVPDRLALLNVEIVKQAAEILKDHIKAGQFSLSQSYASAMWTNDFLHTAGLISNDCFEKVNVLSTIFQLAATIEGAAAALFGGASPFAPMLKTYMEANSTGAESKEALEEIRKLLPLAGEAAAAVG